MVSSLRTLCVFNNGQFPKKNGQFNALKTIKGIS